jgi:uncharacterized protein YjiS (DUF1127 family)
MMTMRTTYEMTHRTFADFGAVLAATFYNGAQKVKAVVRLWSNRRAAMGLVEMDDYLLKDLGLTRSEVEHALRSGNYLSDPSITLARHAGVRMRKPLSELSLG